MKYLKYIQGYKGIWALFIMLCLISFIPVYSTSSYFAHRHDMSTTSRLIRHFFHIVLGIAIVFLVHKRDFAKIRRFSPLLLILVVGLLVFTLFQGETIRGENASRWLRIPKLGSFQPSALAGIALVLYLAKVMGRVLKENIQLHFKHIDFLKIIGSIILICGLIFPANLSTAGIIAFIALLMLMIAHFPKRLMFYILSFGLVLGFLFIGLAMIKPDLFPSRVNTWSNRIESFTDSKEGYQSLYAKNAIINGGFLGKGPSKSIYKNVLPQSSSDFIFAIIVEEWGVFAALIVIVFYTMLFFQGMALFRRTEHPADKLTVLGLVLWITTQAFVNISVAEGLMPVTGQTLPLISTGGSSIFMTSLAIGLLLSISRNQQKIEK